MADEEDGTVVLGDPVFQPFGGLEIKVVGWLVENEKVRFFEKDSCDREAGLFAAAQGVGRLVEFIFFEPHLDEDGPNISLCRIAFRIQKVLMNKGILVQILSGGLISFD